MSSHLTTFYRRDLGLLTDLYQLTMAKGYWHTGLYKRKAVFHLFYRKPPFDHPYVVTAGLALAIDYLQKLTFSVQDIQYLGSLKDTAKKPLFDESFLNFLQRMKFSCSIDAIPEGTVVLPHEPLVRVKGPIIQAQLIETALLNIINFSSLIATKSSRIVHAAGGEEVLEFGLRRAQGIDGGLTASRAAYIGGCSATSNVLAGQYYGIPVRGTHAHSWVMAIGDEVTAFSHYAEAMPNNCIFLVDTYDTIEGIKNAIQVGKAMRENGHEMGGIRLDSGDLASLSKEARKLLDESGFEKAAIVASNDLDEYQIKTLKEQGANITVWGVGTRLITAYDQPALGGVYKLAAIENEYGELEYRLKVSEQWIKTSNPGVLQVKRFHDRTGKPIGDQIYSLEHGEPTSDLFDYPTDKRITLAGYPSKNLLVPIFEDGKLVYNLPPLNEIRQHCLQQQSLFADINWRDYYWGLEAKLHSEKQEMINALSPLSQR